MVDIIRTVREEDEKWVKHYSSVHQILIVGDGDFSFSLSLATSFGSALNITATSLDSYDALMKKYSKAKSNLDYLLAFGASIIHGVDATRMKLHADLKMRRFDRIVYNFPHAGFHGKEDKPHIIRKHVALVQGFFHNASGMLRPNGEIHVTHKTTAPFHNWNLEKLASLSSLALSACVPFKIGDYPGYNNKRGDGSRSDDRFPLGECSTFIFILVRGYKKSFSGTTQKSSMHVFDQTQLIPATQTYGHRYYNTAKSESGRNWVREESIFLFDQYFNHAIETFGVPDVNINYNVQKALSQGYDRFVNNAYGRPSSDFIFCLKEIHQLSISRIEWLENLLRGMN